MNTQIIRKDTALDIKLTGIIFESNENQIQFSLLLKSISILSFFNIRILSIKLFSAMRSIKELRFSFIRFVQLTKFVFLCTFIK